MKRGKQSGTRLLYGNDGLAYVTWDHYKSPIKFRIGSNVPTVVIPGDRVQTPMDLHRQLADALDFGPYYGKNLSALRDELTTNVERPVHIVWAHAAESRRALGDEFFDKVVALIRDAAQRDSELPRPNKLTFEVQE